MPRQRIPDLISVIEAIYDVDQPREHWLNLVMDVAKTQLPNDAGVGGVFYRIGAGTLTLEHIAARHELEGWLDVGRRAHADPSMRDSIRWGYQNVLCADMGPETNRLPGHETNTANFRAWNLKGCLLMNGYDPDGFGCGLFLFSSSPYSMSSSAYAAYCRIATHLATAYRLQRRLGLETSAPGRGDVVFDSRGRPQCGEDGLCGASVERALTDAFRAIRWARGTARRQEPLGALEAWRGRVTGRWTLVDSLDAGGRRYVLARENTIAPPGPAMLSDRERQVAALAALGRHNKLIAYELGIAPATVRVLLARAAAKFRVKSRKDLVERYRAHELRPRGLGQ